MNKIVRRTYEVTIGDGVLDLHLRPAAPERTARSSASSRSTARNVAAFLDEHDPRVSVHGGDIAVVHRASGQVVDERSTRSIVVPFVPGGPPPYSRRGTTYGGLRSRTARRRRGAGTTRRRSPTCPIAAMTSVVDHDVGDADLIDHPAQELRIGLTPTEGRDARLAEISLLDVDPVDARLAKVRPPHAQRRASSAVDVTADPDLEDAQRIAATMLEMPCVQGRVTMVVVGLVGAVEATQTSEVTHGAATRLPASPEPPVAGRVDLAASPARPRGNLKGPMTLHALRPRTTTTVDEFAHRASEEW